MGAQGGLPLGRIDIPSDSALVAVAGMPKVIPKEQKVRCESRWGFVKIGHGPIKLDILFTHM